MSQESSSRTGALFPPRFLLVVEDDAAVRRLTCHVLSMAGHEVLGVGSVAEALAALDARPYDVVLSDLVLGGSSARSLLRAMQADPRFAAIPVIAVSGAVEASDPAVFRAMGFAAFVTKPYRLHDLLAALEACQAGPTTGVHCIPT